MANTPAAADGRRALAHTRPSGAPVAGITRRPGSGDRARHWVARPLAPRSPCRRPRSAARRLSRSPAAAPSPPAPGPTFPRPDAKRARPRSRILVLDGPRAHWCPSPCQTRRLQRPFAQRSSLIPFPLCPVCNPPFDSVERQRRGLRKRLDQTLLKRVNGSLIQSFLF